MTIFLSGGAKNGKSTWAQRFAKQLQGDGPLYYLATMIPPDEEDEQRIRRHLQERDGWGFTTVECGRDILHSLTLARPEGTFLLDSVTALLSNEMFPAESGMDRQAPLRVARQLKDFCRQVGHAVLVSDYIYSDARRYDPWTEAYRRGLAEIDRTLVNCCDAVGEVCAGNLYWHKGGAPR